MNDFRLSVEQHRWLTDPLPANVVASLQRLEESDDVCHIAVMPDIHLAGDVCIGVAVGTRELIYPAAVGGDIGCGMAAIRFEASAELIADEVPAAQVLAGLYRQVPSNRHSRETLRASLPTELDHQELSHPRLEKSKRRDGRVQFGTLGRGNHFLELQSDSEGRLWLMVHSGSRAMGQAITSHHLATAARSSSGLLYLDGGHATGQSYLADVQWAVTYAAQSRLAMVEATANLMEQLFGIEANWESLIDCNHNHVRRELHFDQELWVHRKGALSAEEGEPGVIPGSMGTRSFHVTGRGEPRSLKSSSHGAGRTQSRQAARRLIGRRQFERQMEGVWFDRRRADRLRDEAPSAYRDIGRVMRSQRDLTRIVREVRPVLSYKGL